MTTLYKRASPSQAMILRIIEGALKNACDAHNVPFDPYFARSVAKRAAGTLSSCLPEVLAAKPSEKLGAATILVSGRQATRRAQVTKPSDSSQTTKDCEMGRSHLVKIAPLRQLEKYLFKQMRSIKLSGNTEKANAFVEILREISKLKS